MKDSKFQFDKSFGNDSLYIEDLNPFDTQVMCMLQEVNKRRRRDWDLRQVRLHMLHHSFIDILKYLRVVETFTNHLTLSSDLDHNGIRYIGRAASSNTLYQDHELDDFYVVTVLLHTTNGASEFRIFAVTFKEDKRQLNAFLISMAAIRHSQVQWQMERDKDEVFNRIFLIDDQKEKIFSEVKNFLASEALYAKELQLPWKRGLIFHGPPGNGKTLMIKTIAKYFGLVKQDLSHLVNHFGELELLPSLTTTELHVHYEQQFTLDDVMNALYPQHRKPVLYFIEDLDKFAATQSRDIPRVSLQSLLKGIDGVNEIDGALLIATVNDTEGLSDALMARPGRFDSLYAFVSPSVECIEQMLMLHQITIIDSTVSLHDVAKELRDYSMAFCEEYVKYVKMTYHTSRISMEQSQVALNKIRQHCIQGQAIGF